MDRREFTIKVVSPLLFTIGLFLTWEVVCRMLKVPLTILPAPSDVFGALWQYRKPIWDNSFVTLWTTLAGFLLATVFGLGLGIVRHLVQLHGGSVRAESPGTGHGATFIVTLPVFEPATVVPDVVQRKPLASLAIAHKLDAARVLVVEDDDDAR